MVNLNTIELKGSIKMLSTALLYFLLLLCFVNSALAENGANPQNGIASSGTQPAQVYPWNSKGVPDYSLENNGEKRANSKWNNLNTGWGKRSELDDSMLEVGPRSGGYRNAENFEEANNALNNRNDNEIDNDAHNSPTDRDYQELIKFEEIYSLPSSVVNDLLKPPSAALYNENKRAWRNLNVAWGKRRPNNEWNKFRVGYCSRVLGCLDWYNFILKLDILKNRNPELARAEIEGAWGKREPAWNNLKGLWGKRASNWNKLNSAWGKRTMEDFSDQD